MGRNKEKSRGRENVLSEKICTFLAIVSVIIWLLHLFPIFQCRKIAWRSHEFVVIGRWQACS